MHILVYVYNETTQYYTTVYIILIYILLLDLIH